MPAHISADIEDKQVLDFESPPIEERTPMTKERLSGIVVDDTEAELTGFDSVSTSARLRSANWVRATQRTNPVKPAQASSCFSAASATSRAWRATSRRASVRRT